MVKLSKTSWQIRAEAELELRRRQAKPLSFREYVDRVNPKYQWYRHCQVMADVLQRVADDELQRVMFFMPPRHGKSETVSRLFPAYYLYRHPDRWAALTSYGASLAQSLSRAARNNYLRGGGVLRDDASSVAHWETRQGGGLWATGVGGSATGKGFHLGLIDDPHKDAQEAASEAIRERDQDWYRSVFSTREEPGGAQIVTLTRWPPFDLAAFILSLEEEDPEHWHIVNFEAIKEEEPIEFPPTCTLEPDWRQPGEALCPERYPLKRLQKIRSRETEYFWNALYQQRPRPREGAMFKRHWFDVVDSVPYHAKRVRWWDCAATDGDGDWTAGVLVALHQGTYYVEDVVRGQWSTGKRNQIIRDTADADSRKYDNPVEVWREQEPGSAGKDVAIEFVRMLAGYNAHTRPTTGDKVTNAQPIAAQAEIGNVKMLRAKWNNAFLDELCNFPLGTNDDQVDGAANAFNRLARGGDTDPNQWATVKR